MDLTERDKIVLGKLRKNYYLKPEESMFRRKSDKSPVKGGRMGTKKPYRVIDISIKGKVKHYSYHRAIWLFVYGELPKELDHIDGNPLNNRISNLRAVTRRENNLNSVYQWKPNKYTGVPGVCMDSLKGKTVSVRIRDKLFHFRDKYEAFFWVMFVGRFYRKPTPSPSRGGGEETQGRNE